MMNLKKSDLVIVILMYALSFFFILESREFPPGSAAFPRAVAWILVALTTLLLLQGFAGKIKRPKKKDETVPKKFYIAASLSIAYIIMVNITGYVLTTPVYLFLLISGLGYKNRKMAALISIVVVAMIYAGFKLALNVPIPTGIIFSG